MIKILKYSSIIILYFFTGCLFTEPINEKVNSNFIYSGDFLVNTPISLLYDTLENNKSDLKLTWQIKKVPPYSLIEENSFLPSNDKNKRIFIPDIPGNYVISLEVEDKYHAKSITEKTIIIKNNLPIAVIKSLNDGNDFVINRELTFDASNSYDIDYNKIISYKWLVTSFPKGSMLMNEASESTLFQIQPDISGNYGIRLTVLDVNKEENYTTYSFYIQKNIFPNLVKTNPDNNIFLIPISKDETKEITALFIDKSTNTTELKYQWYISINNDDYFLLSNDNKLNLNANNYGTGDLLGIKLKVTNSLNNSNTTLWRFIITE